MTRTTLLKLIQMYIGTDQPWISLVEGDEQQEYRPKCVSCCVNKIANIFDVAYAWKDSNPVVHLLIPKAPLTNHQWRRIQTRRTSLGIPQWTASMLRKDFLYHSLATQPSIAESALVVWTSLAAHFASMKLRQFKGKMFRWGNTIFCVDDVATQLPEILLRSIVYLQKPTAVFAERACLLCVLLQVPTLFYLLLTIDQCQK